MNIYFDFDRLPKFRKPVVTVGSFDGVHFGHRTLLDYLKRETVRTGGESVAVTFAPHPRQVLEGGGNIRLLTTLREKTLLLSELGVDNLIVVTFTPEFSRLSSREFVIDRLVGKVGMKRMVVGYNHRFGRDNEGDASSLEELAAEAGFHLDSMPQYMLGGRKVSSTEIRNLIDSGNLRAAEEMLMNPYFIIGDIVGGVVYLPDEAKLLPPEGRYDVSVNGWRDELFVGSGALQVGSCQTASNATIQFIA